MDKIRVARVDNISLERLIPPKSPKDTPKRDKLSITLHLTPHHLIFCPPTGTSSSANAPNDEIWVPYPSITSCKRLPQTIAGLYPVQIKTRTYDTYVLIFEKDRDGGAEDVWQSVKDCAVATSVEQLYAFFYTLQGERSGSSSQAGWGTFNPRTEFARQGLGTRTKAWRFTDINKEYNFCPTYPSKLVVPSRISDSTLAYAGKYRSKARIPALTYLHWANHASITRSSQPMVGLKNARSAQDERLVECIFSSHNASESAYAPSAPISNSTVFGATSTNLIIDARPTANAMANVAVGAGTENMDNYRMGKKAYLGIDNIHVMRNSLKMITEAIQQVEDGQTALLDRALLRRSNWLKHISTLLDGALVIIKNVHLNASHVLIHCSDGWDRTSQLSAVSQVCLDPYYRTFEGFKVLIEKDWLSFGHKFLDRSGHLSSEKLFTVEDVPEDDSEDEGVGAQKAAQAIFAWGQKQFATSNSHAKEISPVFHQFLDCVRQIQRQYPTRFEFNEDYLLDLYYHLYACQFGTFLSNSEHDRREPSGPGGKSYTDRTVSAWDWFDQPSVKTKYINPDYDYTLDDREARSSEADQGVLLFDPRDVRFWHGLFRRGDEEMNGGRPTQTQSGADVAIVSPGQTDPVTIEGVIASSAPNGRNLGVESITSSRSASPLPASTQMFNSTARETAREERNNNRSSAWNWSKVSSGAFSALSGAAREIRSIGSEAMNQIRQEAHEVQDEVWSRDESSGEALKSTQPNGAARLSDGQVNPLPSRKIGRIPSEANPWSVETRSTAVGTRDEWNSNPWTQPKATTEPLAREPAPPTTHVVDSASLGSLHISGETAETTERRLHSTTIQTSKQEGSWDPLGAI